MVRYKTVRQFEAESGYTSAAIRTKIQRGVWLEGRVWRRAPDGTILIDIEGYNEWVENGNGLASSPRPTARSRSASPTKASTADLRWPATGQQTTPLYKAKEQP